MLKEATIYFCLFDESHYVIMECIEINWLCKHRKKNRGRQASISINSWVELSKIQFALWVSSALIRLLEGSFSLGRGGGGGQFDPPLQISRRTYLISV